MIRTAAFLAVAEVVLMRWSGEDYGVRARMGLVGEMVGERNVSVFEAMVAEAAKAGDRRL